MLSVEHIRKYYDGQLLLDNVSFAMGKAETICLLGSSGSGKSTLLKIIAGLELPEQGSVLWDGQDIASVPVHQRNFGLMFQEYALFPHRSVAQNVAFGLEMKKDSAEQIKQKVGQALERVGMLAFANRRVTELSGGEKQRVALARALAPQPRLLMLDEPLGALDRGLKDQLIQDLRMILRQSAIPAIYVTHDQEEAYTIADRMLLLHEGKIMQEGKPQELYDHPINAWVAGFLGLNNQINGVVIALEPLTVHTELGDLVMDAAQCIPLRLNQKVTTIIKQGGVNLFPSLDGEHQARVKDCVFSGEVYRLTLEIEHVEIKVISADGYPTGALVGYNINPDAMLCVPTQE